MVETKCLENQTSKYISNVWYPIIDLVEDAIEMANSAICKGGNRNIVFKMPIDAEGLEYKLGGIQVEDGALYTLDEKLNAQEFIGDLTLDIQVVVVWYVFFFIQQYALEKEMP